MKLTTPEILYPYSNRTNLSPTNNPNAPKLTNDLFVPYDTLGPVDPNSLTFIAVIQSENPINPYIQMWSLGVQRELSRNTTVEINYIGTKGTHFLNRRQIAQPYGIPDADLPFCQKDPSDVTHHCPTNTRLPYQHFTQFYINSDWHGYSNYNGMNVKVEHRSANLAGTAVYTWAKSMDDKSATAGIGASGSGYQGFQDNHNPQKDYGLSDFSVGQRFVASFVYQLPFGRGQKFGSSVNRGVDLAIGGWQITGIATFQQGFPYSIGATDAAGLLFTQAQRASMVPGCNPRHGFTKSLTKQFNTELLLSTRDRRLRQYRSKYPHAARHQQLGSGLHQELPHLGERALLPACGIVQHLQPSSVQRQRGRIHGKRLWRWLQCRQWLWRSTVWTNHSGLPWTHHSIRRKVNLLIKAIQIRHSIMEWRIFFDRDKLARMINSRRCFPGALLVLCLSIPSAFAQSTNDELMQKYAEEGQKAMASGHYAEAEKSFVAMEKLQPSIAEIHATLGVIYFTEKKFDKAVAEIRQAEKLKPGLPNLNTLLALSLSELGQYEEALPNLETGFQQATEPSVKRMCGLQLMRAYSALQRDSQAVDVALKLDSAFPNDPEVLYQTSRVYGNSAFLNMQKLRREAPNSVWRHLAAAEAYESEGQYNNAIDEYHQVLVLEPRRLGVHYRIGRTMLARSRQANSPADIAEARKEFEAELALDPHNGNATYELAEMHRNAGELDQAQKLFESALRRLSRF